MMDIERLFELEKRYNLFQLKSKDEFPVWDILRYHVYGTINQYPQAKFKKVFFPNIARVKKSVISLFNLITSSKENLFFLCSRNNLQDGSFYDKNANHAINLIPQNTITIFESNLFNGKYHYFDFHHFQLEMLLKFFARSMGQSKIPHDEIKQIVTVFNKETENNPITIDGLLHEYEVFLKSYNFYCNLFVKKRSKTKRIFLTQNGIQKGLLLAAQKHNIPVYEFQHGIVDHTHVAYSYSPTIHYTDQDIIYPKVFFTLGTYWEGVFFHPFTKKITIGNNDFVPQIKHTGEKFLTVVSSLIHEFELRRIVSEIAAQSPQLKIFFKLHPNQFFQKDETIKHFEKFPQITVISGEQNMPRLISRSKAILTIVSTAVYEALQAKVNVFILKKQNYKAHKDVFNLPGVFLIDHLSDFNQVFYHQCEKTPWKENIFFEPFRKDVFLHSIQ